MNIEIFGTLGPADCEVPVITEMFENGMTGIRLNLSHKSLPECAGWLDNYFTAAKNSRIPFCPELLIDLQGPELRIGNLPGDPFTLDEGSRILLIPEGADKNSCSDSCAGSAGKVSPHQHAPALRQDGPLSPLRVPCPGIIFPCLHPGQKLLLNDGIIEAEVEKPVSENIPEGVLCRILRGGTLSSRKSLALPGAALLPPTLTPADLGNLDCADKYHVTGVMLPFVRNAGDLAELRRELQKRNLGHIRIFAKIENMSGVEMLPELLPYCDHIVIARGDLANAAGLTTVIGVQKHIAALCRKYGMPFTVVTQMLASMETNPLPTRAEVSDIFNAVLDGASSLMLTGETAVGKYPVSAIRYLSETAREAAAYMAQL